MNLDSLLESLAPVVESSWFVTDIIYILLVGALCVWLYAWRLGSWVKRDVDALMILLDGSLESLVERASTLKRSHVSEHLGWELNDICTLGSRRFRVCSSNSERFEGLVHKYVDARTLDAWPNVFVGMGLLLTFFCLAVSLLAASQGAASGDITLVKKSVTDLLKLSASKFMLSLVALGLSIVLGIFLRLHRTRIERKLRSIDEKLARILPYLTLEQVAAYEHSEAYRTDPERLFSERSLASTIVQTFTDAPQLQHLAQTIEEIRDHSAGTEEELQSFNSDLAVQLGKALDDKLQPMLEQLANRLETALRNMGQVVGGSLGESNQQALRSTLDAFVKELRDATKNDSAELQQKMQQLADELGRASSNLAERMNGVFSGMEATGDRFSAALHEASAAFRQEIGHVQDKIGSGLTQTLTTLMASAERSSRESEAMVEKLAAGATSFHGSVSNGANSFVSEMERGAYSISGTIERLGLSVAELGAIVDRAAFTSATLAQRTEERVQQLHTTLGAIDASFKQVGEASKPFAQAAEQVRSAIDLLRVTENSVEAKVATLQRGAESISETSKSFSETMGREVTRMTEGLDSRTERLTAAIEDVAKESESGGKRFEESIEKTLKEYENRFAGIDHELGKALEKTIGTFTATYEDIGKRVTQLDSEMAKGVSGLCDANKEFAGHVEDLTDAIISLKPIVAK